MRLAERRALKETNFDLFDSVAKHPSGNSADESISLPTEDELAAIFRDFNDRHFDGKLPTAKVEWSSRMKHAGRCYYSDRIIRLGVSYHTYYPEDVTLTLKHEMIHLVIPNHGSEFKREARRIGATRYARHYPGMLRGMKYLYECPTCGETYPSRKILRLRSCGKCSNGRYDVRHKLRLVRRLDDN